MAKKTIKRKTGGRKSKGAPARVKVLLGFLVLVGVVGIVGVKFLQTGQGRVLLLDRGFLGYYAEVQMDTGIALREALGEMGLRRHIYEKLAIFRVKGRELTARRWTIACKEDENLVLINVALTNAVRRSGARVRRSEERDDGRTLMVTIGSARYDTHRILIHRTPPAKMPPPPKLPKLAIVIDDFGYARNGVAEGLLALDLPLSIAILPDLPQSTAVLERAKSSGHCVLLHLPMEGSDPLPMEMQVVSSSMGDDEITALVTRYVESLPGIDGVNNHQGSQATEDKRVMTAALSAIAGSRLFFLDSLTSRKSVAYNTAVEMGIPAAANNVFLDADTEDAGEVGERLYRLVAMAHKRGSAIGIGHPHRWTLKALRDYRPYLLNAGVELVAVSALVTPMVKTVEWR